MGAVSKEAKAHHYNLSVNWIKTNKERYAMMQRRAQLKRAYGISIVEYTLMLANTPYCPGCGVEFPKDISPSLATKSTKAYVDHCHETNRVRGLLCGRCNSTIGYAKNNPQILRALADYLEK